jgi:hypothetical protein
MLSFSPTEPVLQHSMIVFFNHQRKSYAANMDSGLLESRQTKFLFSCTKSTDTIDMAIDTTVNNSAANRTSN